MPRIATDDSSRTVPAGQIQTPDRRLRVSIIGALDQTIMAQALPAVAGDLGRLNQIPAVVTAYLAAATVVMPAAAGLLPVRIPLRMRPDDLDTGVQFDGRYV